MAPMIRFRTVLLASLCLSLLLACEEIPPNIDLQSDSGESDEVIAVGAQSRQVLVEEFTGVRCVNCPAGTALLNSLKETYGNQLIPISIHTGFYAEPYQGHIDFRTADGDAIAQYLGAPLGYPSAVVNRKKFDSENRLQLSKSKWAGYVAEEVQLDPLVRIGMRAIFDQDSNKLVVKTSVHVDEDLDVEDLRLTVMVLENGIIDKQASTSGEIEDYEHKHVLRKILTPYTGYSLGGEHAQGDILNNSFGLDWHGEWVYENCELVAFVSLGGEQKDVLQATEAELLP